MGWIRNCSFYVKLINDYSRGNWRDKLMKGEMGNLGF